MLQTPWSCNILYDFIFEYFDTDVDNAITLKPKPYNEPN